jgi:hypothetical protein
MHNRFAALLALAICLTLGLMACGFALDAVLGPNDELWARAVRWIATFAVIFGMIAVYDKWKPGRVPR